MNTTVYSPMNGGNNFSRHLALCQQLWREIDQICSIDEIEKQWETLTAPKKEVLRDRLMRLSDHLGAIKKIEEEVILKDDLPWQEVGEELGVFYQEKLRPRFERLWSLGLLIDLNLGDLNLGTIEPISSAFDDPPDKDVAAFMQAAVERCEGLWEELPEENMVFSEFSYDQAMKLVSSGLFCPDQWLENLEIVKPVISSKGTSRIPLHTRARISEIYRAFIFGNWLAVKSLCRSLLEYEILDRSGVLKISVRKENGDTKNIGELIQLVVAIGDRSDLSSLEDEMRLVVGYGNDVMHPKKKKNVEMLLTKRGREEALDCICAIQRITERLYQ